MKKAILIFTIAALLSYISYSWAILSQPPVLKDTPLPTVQYLNDLYNNHNVLDITTTAPNGNVTAKRGKIILYNNAGTYGLWVNTDNATTWQAI